MKLHSVCQEQEKQHACTRANLELVLAAWVEKQSRRNTGVVTETFG